MTSNNDVVMIHLDRPRELRYGHKALKQLMAATGKDLDTLTGDTVNLEDIEKIIYYGLLSDARDNNENLKLEQMEDLIDQAPSYAHITQKMSEAMSKAFGVAPEQPGNAPSPETLPAK